jgi:hypothetical protein
MNGTRVFSLSGLCVCLLMVVAIAGHAAAGDRCLSQLDRPPDSDQVPDKNSIKVLSVTPEAGAEVHKWTVLEADLAYTLKDFEPEKYFVTAQFEMLSANLMTDANFKRINYHYLTLPAGAYRLCFHLADIWNLADVRRPFQVHFLLNKRDTPNTSHSVAFTDKMPLLVK